METKETRLEKRMKKSTLIADEPRAYEYLTNRVEGLLPCKIEEEGEDILFTFDLEDIHPFSQLKTEDLEYKYRFLQNFGKLQETWQNYKLFMQEENMFYDSNFMPYFAIRDIKVDAEEDSFWEEYQYLATGILNKKYSYTQVKESGMEIVRKDRSVSFIPACESLEDLCAVIKEKAEELHEINKNQKIKIDRKKHQRQKRICAGVIGLLLVMLIITGYQTFVVSPRDKAVIRARRAYTVENYMNCIDFLKNLKTKQEEKLKI